MTTEEKITELINIRDNFNYTLAPREVFDDAIKALRQEPCEDAISRQAVIDAIYANSVWANEYNLTLSRIKSAVEKLPSVQPDAKVLEKTKSIVAEWKADTWTDNLSYECMVKIAKLVEPQEGSEADAELQR